MVETFLLHKDGILKAFIETNIMMFVSVLISIVLSIFLGTLLFSLNREYLIKNKILYEFLSFVLNALRSVPFLIFIFVLIPVNRFIFGTSYGIVASFIPLILVTTSLLTRFVEQAYVNVSADIVDRAISMGASKYQIIYYFLFPTIISDIILSLTSVIISTLSYSTVMGVIGAGGLGDYAFRYGYQEYNYKLMYVIILIFIVYVFFIQSVGYIISKKFRRYREE